MYAVALVAAALAVVSPQSRLENGNAVFRIRLADGAERVRHTGLAAPRRTAIGAYLSCRSGGVGVIYGTAGWRVHGVSVVLADGRREKLHPSTPPDGWSYAGDVWSRVM